VITCPIYRRPFHLPVILQGGFDFNFPEIIFDKLKVLTRYIIPLLLIWPVFRAQAQPAKKTSPDRFFRLFSDTTQPAFSDERPYYICYSEHGEWIKDIPGKWQIVRQLDENTVIARIRDKFVLQDMRDRIRINAANDLWKYSPSFHLPDEGKRNDPVIYTVSGSGFAGLLQSLVPLQGRALQVLSENALSNSVVVRTTPQFLHNYIVPLKEVIFADKRVTPRAEAGIIGYNRSFHGLSALDYTITGADGQFITVGVKEQNIDANDIDLIKRVLPSSLAAPNITSHATVVSSIIGGGGNSYYDGRGVAWKCQFFPSSFGNLFADDPAVLDANKVSVQNHSYGTVIQQFYGSEAVSYDMHTWLYSHFVHVFSAGNQGTAFATEGPYAGMPGFANLTANFKMAKNVITVGAVDNKGTIPAESSAGPLYDGRIAPQLTALGPNGTSDAAALVSGTVAVMQQVYADQHNGELPPASMIKAILYNRAEDIFRKGIDYKTGYGLLNSLGAVRSLIQGEYDGGAVAQDQLWSRTISIPVNCARLKVTLSWTDSAGTVNNNKALVNDLDLTVENMSAGEQFLPWVLSAAPFADSLTSLPVRKRDSLNTAEQVSIENPPEGNYQINVKGTMVQSSAVKFNVSFHTDTLNTFYFTYPNHSADVNIEENPYLDIKWTTFLPDTSLTADLYISYDNGSVWELIKPGLKMVTNGIQWLINDTSSRARLKMVTPFGDFFSTSFIIARPLRPVVDFLCTDSVRISWNKYVYADSYRIYYLADTPYLKQLVNITDTFITLNRSAYPSLVYAVEPLTANGIPAARSRAVDITLLGVKCFYKTLYYTLLDENKADLVTELSATDLIDSVYYEQVNAGGQLINVAGSSAVSGNSGTYHQFINEMPRGISYWRVRIKLKSGAIVYTETISILTSGSQYILFYPNPVRTNQPLHYVLRQGGAAYSRLQLFDITGRLLKDYQDLPDVIYPASLSAGVIIYKLISENNTVLETGKFIVY